MKLKNNDKFLFLGNRINADLPYQSGGNGKFMDSIPGEIEPKPYDSNIQKYFQDVDYQELNVMFECK